MGNRSQEKELFSGNLSVPVDLYLIIFNNIPYIYKSPIMQKQTSYVGVKHAFSRQGSLSFLSLLFPGFQLSGISTVPWISYLERSGLSEVAPISHTHITSIKGDLWYAIKRLFYYYALKIFIYK